MENPVVSVKNKNKTLPLETLPQPISLTLITISYFFTAYLYHTDIFISGNMLFCNYSYSIHKGFALLPELHFKLFKSTVFFIYGYLPPHTVDARVLFLSLC